MLGRVRIARRSPLLLAATQHRRPLPPALHMHPRIWWWCSLASSSSSSSSMAAPSTAHAPKSPPPAIAMLRILADMHCSRSNTFHPSTSTSLTLRTHNKRLHTALTNRDYALALRELQALLQRTPVGKGVDQYGNPLPGTSHPVEAVNYDALLFEWSKLQPLPVQAHSSSDGGTHTTTRSLQPHLDVSPMIALLDDMVVWRRASPRSFNTVLVACNKRHALAPGLDVLAKMKEAKKRVGVFAYVNLISCCGRLASKHKKQQHHFVAQAEQLWRELLATDAITPTIVAVNAMTFVYRATQGRSLDAVALVEMARRELQLAPDQKTIATLLTALLKDGNVLEASRWLEFAIRHGIRVEPPLISTVMDSCRAMEAWSRADSVTAALNECSVGLQDRALQGILTRIQRRDAVSAFVPSRLTSQFTRRQVGTHVVGKETAVNKSVQTRKQSSQDATHGAATKVVATNAKASLRHVMGALERDASQREWKKPSKKEWQRMILNSPVDEVDQLMAMVYARTDHSNQEIVLGVPVAWMSLQYIRALSAVGRWEKVVDVVEDIVARRANHSKGSLLLDVSGFNAAVSACAKAGRMQEATRIMEYLEEEERSGLHKKYVASSERLVDSLRPNRQSYEAVLSGCAAQGRHGISPGMVELAERTLSRMYQVGDLKPSILNVNSVLKCYGALAQRMMDDERRFDLSGHHFRGYGTHDDDESEDGSGNWDTDTFSGYQDGNALARNALSFYHKAISKYGVHPNEATIYHLFRSFLALTDLEENEEVEARGDNEDATGRSDDTDEVEEEAKYFRDLSGQSQQTCSDRVDRSSFHELAQFIQGICRDAPLDIVSARVVNIALDFFHRHDDANSTFEMYSTMVSRGILPTRDTVRMLFAISGDADTPELGSLFLNHLLTANPHDGHAMDPSLKRAITHESLKWAARMTASSHLPSSSTPTSSSTLVDDVIQRLVAANVVQSLDESVYTDLLGVFGNNGHLREARQMLTRMQHDLGYVTTPACNRVLQACSVAKLPLPALDTLRWMQDKVQVIPDLVSYNTVLGALRRSMTRLPSVKREHDQEEDVDVDDEEESDAEDGYDDYDTGHSSEDADAPRVPRRHRRDDRLQERLYILERDLPAVVESLMKEMSTRYGLQPNALTYHNAMAILSLLGDSPRVVTCMDQLLGHGSGGSTIDAPWELVNEAILTSYLDACAQLGERDRIRKLEQLLVEWTQNKRYTVPSSVVLHLLLAYDAVDAWRDALSLVRSLQERFGVRPTVTVLHTIMALCNRVEQWQHVEPIFLTMQKPGATRVFPTAACYVEVIYALEQQELWPRATTLFLEMQQKCKNEEVHPALLHRIALGRYSEGRRRPD